MFKLIKEKYRGFKSWMDYNPPPAFSSKGWRLFDKEYKEKAPIRYFFSKDFPRKILWPIANRYKDIKYWVKYRTTSKYHIIKTGLKPNYYAIDTIMLNVNFNLLKDFVEVEQAWQNYSFSDDYKKISWWEKRNWRSPKHGIAHFEWASKLDDPALPPFQRSDYQAVAAREILELYRWWVNIRPNRVPIDPGTYNRQGLDMSMLDADFDDKAPDFIEYRKKLDELNKQEDEWAEEDTSMLVRLMKIRGSIWT